MEAPESSKCCLRIDNSIACSASLGMYCLVDGYEQVGGLDVGVNSFGYFAERNNVWSIRSRTLYRDTAWMLFADSAAFWLNMKVIQSSSDTFDPISDIATRSQWRAYFFGDVLKRNPGDVYSCLLVSSISPLSSFISSYDNGYLGGNSSLFNSNPGNSGGLSFARNAYGAVGKNQPSGTNLAWHGLLYSGRGPLAYPSPVDNSLIVIPNGIHLMDSTSAIRGNIPGFWTLPQSLTDVLGPAVIYDNFPGAELRKFISMYAQYYSGYTNADQVYCTAGFIDLTGPWR